MRRDCDIGMKGLRTSGGYEPSAVGKNERAGHYGSGSKSASRRRDSLTAIRRIRRRAKTIGMIVALVGAITVLSAVAMMLSEKAAGPGYPAETSGTLPPVASFTNTTYPSSNLTVMVDASASNDPDGSIVSYAWDFGDGGVGTDVIAYHTYATWGQWWITLTVTDNDAMTGVTSVQVNVSKPSSPPPIPYNVIGYVYESDGVTIVLNAAVTITDTRTGAVWLTTTDAEFGYYVLNLNLNETGWEMGDTIVVDANNGVQSGTNSGVTGATGNEAFLLLDVTLTVAIPEFPMVVLPVLGMIGVAAVLSLRTRFDEK